MLHNTTAVVHMEQRDKMTSQPDDCTKRAKYKEYINIVYRAQSRKESQVEKKNKCTLIRNTINPPKDRVDRSC